MAVTGVPEREVGREATGGVDGSELSRVADLLVGVGALLLLVAYVPGLYFGSSMLRTLLAWVLGGAGLVSLAVLARRGDAAARWAVGFLAWAGLSVWFSGRPSQSLRSDHGIDGGWVYLAAYLGCWALARRRGQRGARVFLGALGCGLAVNLALVYAQALVDGDQALLALQDGRATGFTENPIFLSALMAGATVLVAQWCVRSSSRWWWAVAALVALAAGAVNLGGSRVALGIAFVLSVALSASIAWRRAVVVAVALVIGIAGTTGLLDDAGTARAAGGGGVTPRTQMWRAGLDAALERPVLGWGPNRFRQATQERVTPEFVRAEGPDRLYVDAHNLFVEHLVTTGAVGLGLLVAFGWTASRRAKGPLVWFAAAVAGTWLLEPTAASTAPIALLALGFAGARSDPDPALASRRPRIGARVVGVGLVVLGLVAGTRVVLVDHHLYRAVNERSLREASRAMDLLPRDAFVAAQYGRLARDEALGDPTDANDRRALAALRRPIALDPTQPQWWTQAGFGHLSFGPGTATREREQARRHFTRALSLNRWSALALFGMYRIATEEGDAEAAAAWADRLCRIDQCPLDVDQN